MKGLHKWYVILSLLLFITLLTACQHTAPSPVPDSGDEDASIPAESPAVQPEPRESISPSAPSAGSEAEPAASAEGGQSGETVPASSETPGTPSEESGPQPGEVPSVPEEAPEAPPEPEPSPEPSPEPEPEPAVKKGTLYVLMYHSFVPDGTNCNNWTLPESRFREDLQWLADNGYTTILPSELAAGQPLPEKPVLLTFDDGYENNYTIAYPILQEFQAKAVISLIVSGQDRQDPGSLTWDMCAEMLQSGLVEIGSHTYDCHTSGIRRAEGESQEAYEARVLTDIQASIDLIESNLDTTVQFFAYPHGQTEPWANAYLKEHFAVTVTTHYGSADLSRGLYNLNRCNISLVEPPSFTLPEG